MNLLVLLLILLVLFGGFGYGGYRGGWWGRAPSEPSSINLRAFGGGLGLILLLVVIYVVFFRSRF